MRPSNVHEGHSPVGSRHRHANTIERYRLRLFAMVCSAVSSNSTFTPLLAPVVRATQPSMESRWSGRNPSSLAGKASPADMCLAEVTSYYCPAHEFIEGFGADRYKVLMIARSSVRCYSPLTLPSESPHSQENPTLRPS